MAHCEVSNRSAPSSSELAMKTLLITSDGQCAPRRTRLTATDNTAKPACASEPKQEGNKAEYHHGMNDVAAGKGTQA